MINQVSTIGAVFSLYSILIIFFFRKFSKDLRFPLILIISFAIYSLGFLMRLVGNKEGVDLGFFLTDFSALFLTALFTASLLLGQIKYWKK